jgi:hypothetical protein
MNSVKVLYNEIEVSNMLKDLPNDKIALHCLYAAHRLNDNDTALKALLKVAAERIEFGEPV